MEEQISERILAMQECLEETVKILLKKRLNRIETELQNDESKDRNRLLECLSELAQIVHEQQEYKQITLSFLRSSFMTKSHTFLASCQGKVLFLQENPDEREIDFFLLFTEAEKDVQKLETELRQKFIRVSEGERETIRRWYQELLYLSFGGVLETVMCQNEDEKAVPLLYGGYMEEQRQIGWI